jgi:hypothetical protein
LPRWAVSGTGYLLIANLNPALFPDLFVFCNAQNSSGVRFNLSQCIPRQVHFFLSKVLNEISGNSFQNICVGPFSFTTYQLLSTAALQVSTVVACANGSLPTAASACTSPSVQSFSVTVSISGSF